MGTIEKERRTPNSRGVITRLSLRSLPIQIILWFCDSKNLMNPQVESTTERRDAAEKAEKTVKSAL